MTSRLPAALSVIITLAFVAAPRTRADSAGDARIFAQSIHPIIEEYCLKCHSTEEQKGDLDLERFDSLGEIGKHPAIWQNVAEHLADNEMPPKGKRQLPPAQKTQLTSWLQAELDRLAVARAGDPGPVVLRRLSNAEYGYTVRDLTGVEVLDPLREFPADSAAGEGFTNTGQAMVMSPSLLTKYLGAGRDIASHAVLLPDGMRFSAKTSRRDWTEEILGQIRAFYAEFSEARGATKVNLQGIQFETNGGGRLPVEQYLAATLEERDALAAGTKSVETVAAGRRLSPKYLATLWTVLHGNEPSLLLESLRTDWRAAGPKDAAALAVRIEGWQKALWKFNSVGQIGKRGSPKSWQEAVAPLVAVQEVRVKMPKSAAGQMIKLYLSANPVGENGPAPFVIWERPRLVAPGRADLLLRDVRQVQGELAARRARLFAVAAQCLEAAAEAASASEKPDLAALALRHGVDAAALTVWCKFLGIGLGDAKITSYLKAKIPKSDKSDAIQGWNGGGDLSLVANSSDQEVRIPGLMKPHSVAMHPMPAARVAAGWRSPLAGTVKVEARVQRAHPECGIGVTWFLELRRGASRQQLAAGAALAGEEIPVKPAGPIVVQPGDLISLFVGPRNGSHICGLTAIDLKINEEGAGGREWDLTPDISSDVLAGNPHADRLGHEGVWHFYAEPDQGGDAAPIIPAGSLLAKWQMALTDPKAAHRLAEQLQSFLTAPSPSAPDSPDAALYANLSAFAARNGTETPPPQAAQVTDKPEIALDPAIFGHRPDGGALDPVSLCVRTPNVLEISLPAELAEGCEFVATAKLDAASNAEGAVQAAAGLTAPSPGARREISLATPIIVAEGSPARARLSAAMDDFRAVFPAALCYTKIVPADEVITLLLHYREDDQLARLILDDAQKARLDRLWNELHFVSGDALALVDGFEQLWQFATQENGDPTVLEPMRLPIKEGAAAYKQHLLEAEPRQLQAVLDFANLAYRRALRAAEKADLQTLYERLRAEDVPHEEAIRLTLARIFLAPPFLYRAESPGPGATQQPVRDLELATRLSYFLWSSAPDAELRAAAEAGKLHEPAELLAQTRRMLRDARVRRLATEFGCTWLHIRGFDEMNEKSEQQFPTFGEMRGAMYEESIRFFTELFQNNRPVADLLDADYTFLNQALATHYGIPNVAGTEWRRVDGVKKYQRGGILALATTLAKQSGASRTSPILRGSWIAETLLGDRLPKPPKDVPRLPEDEATESLTVRQLTEKHVSDPRCAGCHERFDAFGFALENFDTIGRWREKDLGGRPIDAHASAPDGADLSGFAGLRDYLLTTRRPAFVHQFCRKLLGYALGRAVQLSDEPLLKEIQARLASDDHADSVVEMIVQSRQFRDIRGRASPVEE